jgi:hypothetical protein
MSVKGQTERENVMLKRLAKLGAGLAAVATALLFLPAATADASVCDDGWVIYNAYERMGDAPTAWAILQKLADMGCD